MNIQPLSSCTFDQVLEVWNRGFEGYAVNVHLNLDQLLTRMVYEGKFPEHSFVAMEGDQPAGFVFNAIKEINGRKLAWNGGTGIVPEKRGTGIGKKLIQTSLDYYQKQGVHTAYLEALRSNEPAINLYKKMGYMVIDHLDFLEAESLSETDFENEASGLIIREEPWEKVQHLPFTEKDIPWQNRKENIPDGRSYVVYEQKRPVAYYLSRTIFNNLGDIQGVVLYQLSADEGRENIEEIVKFALKQVFRPEVRSCRRLISNFPNKKETILSVIKNIGFETKLQQVHMKIEW
ncbi:acetyltransferase (GNAT) family protein [Melghiribacillus thermohalophilus]|uniref:Acetyltransferase (GNAT) family protein n=1 Tax=Melghiribacillus thermohalophilus TaxID=1324956 RepID=A0A4R3N145_9BACI|nr:GNAT family N-acetyltransferase [Melghiribacillus thermohalophilus]TCT20339.1 acetyltransferase (GNAT) family protein [Melghiribacillus thermohalophilus]